MPFLIIILLTPLFLYSEALPKNLKPSIIEADPTSVIDGCVDIISGHFFDFETDLVIPGPEPLLVQRVFRGQAGLNASFSTHFGSQWEMAHQGGLELIRDEDKPYPTTANYYGPFGESAHLYAPNTKKNNLIGFNLIKESIVNGATNFTKGLMGGQTNLKNYKLGWDKEKNTCFMFTPNGSLLNFKSKAGKYILSEEIIPSTLKRNYQIEKGCGSIRLTNSLNEKLSEYSYLSIPDGKTIHYIYNTPDNRSVTYSATKIVYAPSEIKLLEGCISVLKHVRSTDQPNIDYKYSFGKKFYEKMLGAERNQPDIEVYIPPKIAQKTKGSQVTQIVYFGESPFTTIKCTNPLFARVEKILAPIGNDTQLFPKYRFEYDFSLPTLEAKVFDALGRKTKYLISDHGKIAWIQKYNEFNQPATIETLHWGKRDTREEMDLQCRTFRNAQSPYLSFAKAYKYDEDFNVKEETLFGNLTGTKENTLVYVEGMGCVNGECFTKNYDYSKDRFHLLTLSVEGNLAKFFKYKDNSNLVTSILHLEGNKGIFKREFFEYDINGLVTTYILDDGYAKESQNLSNVTYRKIEKTKRSTAYPVGLPLEITNLVIDIKTQQELQEKRIVNSFDNQGRLLKQETFDANNQFVYAEAWTYDAHSNVLSYTNKEGNTIYKSYDLDDYLILEQGFNHVIKKYTYDYVKRLTKEEEIHPDGITLTKKNTYDLCSNLLSATDSFGNTTHYTYDAFGRCISTYSPPIVNEHGQLAVSQTHCTYDELGNKTSIKDPEGNVTVFKYTTYGKPYYVLFPDGSEKKYEYDLQGQLIKTIEPNGVTTLFTLDVLGRTIKTQIISPAGELLSQTEAGYSTFQLLWEKDQGGIITHYSYDSYGRKISTRREDLFTHYEYDAMGNVSKISTENIVKSYLYDNLKRIVEEKVENNHNEILTWIKYTYDAEGHKTRIEQDNSLTQIQYDTHGIAAKTIDADGHILKCHLRFDYFNEYGQNVLCQETIDAKGQICRTIHNAQGQITQKIKLNSFGQEIQQEHWILNGNGKCIKHMAKVYGSALIPQIITSYKYDGMNRLISQIEADQSHHQRQMNFSYNKQSQLILIEKSDGVKLHKNYDFLGRMTEMFSSDNSIHYQYAYNVYHKMTQVENCLTHTKTERAYDHHQQLIKEKLANDLEVHMTYNLEGQLIHLQLPYEEEVQYIYKGSQLSQITKLHQGVPQYHHSYMYNKNGKIVKSSLIHSLGDLFYSYSPTGKIIEIKSSTFHELTSYDATGLLTKRVVNGIEENFNYDDLYQLISEPGHSYSYDSVYNRQNKDGKASLFNELNQILSCEGKNYYYDANGNLIAIDDHQTKETFTYDALDRLISHTKDQQTTQYFYDEQNRCVTKNSGIEEKILYIGQNDIATITDNTYKHLRILGTSLGAEIGGAIAIEVEGIPYAPFHDHNGNVIQLIDQQGQLAASYHYSAFGEETTVNKVDNPWRFSSKRKENSYYLFGKRFYDPSTSRWLTKDPIGKEGGLNLYAYVFNNPLTLIDLYGLIADAPNLYDRQHDTHNASFSSGSYSSSLSQSVADIRQSAGQMIKHISTQLIPFPIIKEVGRFIGHCIENISWKGFTPLWSQKHSKGIEISKSATQKNEIVFCNGINTTYDEATEIGKAIASLCEDHSVSIAYNGTHGATEDLGETLLNKLGIPTNACLKAYKTITAALDRAGSNGYVFIAAFSQGGEILHHVLNQLSEAQLSRCLVATFGSARLINNETLAYCKNFISRSDLVPLTADPFNYVATLFGLRNNVEFINNDNLMPQHNFLKTYINKFNNTYESLREKYNF